MGASLVLLGFITTSSEDSNLSRNFFEELFQNIFKFFEQLFQSSTGTTGTKVATSTTTTSTTTAKTNKIQIQNFQVQATQRPTVTRVSFKKSNQLSKQQCMLCIFSTK